MKTSLQISLEVFGRKIDGSQNLKSLFVIMETSKTRSESLVREKVVEEVS